MWIVEIVEEQEEREESPAVSPKYYISVYKSPPQKFKYIRIVHMDDLEVLCCRV